MRLLYNLGIRLLYFGILLGAIFKQKARLWIKGRRNWYKFLQENIPGNTPIAWFHASSLGEFEQGRPIIEALRREKPDYKILLTFFSPSGYEVRKKYEEADWICYLPLDTPGNARKFIQLVKPTLAVFIKYEFWYNILNEAKNHNAQLILVSAIFRPQQVFFKSYGGWYKKLLLFFDHIFLQDSRSFDLLQRIGMTNISIAGDTRFDRVLEIAEQSKEFPVLHRFTEGYFTIICGSTWPEDEEILCRFINQSTKNLRFIIAPHEISNSHIASIEKMIDKRIVKYSQAENDDFSKTRVMVIDNIGMLSSIYKYGHVAYIGGGFGSGIHNILEAAVFALPVIFGPRHTKFREAVELLKTEGAITINNYEEFHHTIGEYLRDPRILPIAAEAARHYVRINSGATDVIMKYLRRS